MNNFQKLLYGLLFVISLSLISASAQATGITIRIGDYGYGHRDYHPPTYYRYRSPIVTHRHHYKPYYSYQFNSYDRNYGYPYYNKHRSGHHDGYRTSHNHHNDHGYSHGSKRHNRHNNHHSNHNRNRIIASKKHIW